MEGGDGRKNGGGRTQRKGTRAKSLPTFELVISGTITFLVGIVGLDGGRKEKRKEGEEEEEEEEEKEEEEAEKRGRGGGGGGEEK